MNRRARVMQHIRLVGSPLLFVLLFTLTLGFLLWTMLVHPMGTWLHASVEAKVMLFATFAVVYLRLGPGVWRDIVRAKLHYCGHPPRDLSAPPQRSDALLSVGAAGWRLAVRGERIVGMVHTALHILSGQVWLVIEHFLPKRLKNHALVVVMLGVLWVVWRDPQMARQDATHLWRIVISAAFGLVGWRVVKWAIRDTLLIIYRVIRAVNARQTRQLQDAAAREREAS